MNQSHFNIEQANKQISNNLPFFLRYFGVKFVDYKNRLTFTCPVHGSDNCESGCLFKENGHFVCWTRHCENSIGYDAYSLFRYLLKKKTRMRTTTNGLSKTLYRSKSIAMTR